MSKVAGIDQGSTLTKVAWLRDGELQVGSTADRPLNAILREVIEHGVDRIRVTGIGRRALPETTGHVLRPSADPIVDEITLQTAGARALLATSIIDPPKEFLLVAVGTGTSYTFVRGDSVTRHPVGSSIGGGFIAGIASLIGLRVAEIDKLAENGVPLDLLVRDLVPETAGSFQGMLVVSSFGRVLADSAPADRAATIPHCAATLIARDIMLLEKAPADVVLVGTVPNRLSTFTRQLTMYLRALGKTVHVPGLGEYATAIGAMESLLGSAT